jgi:broad specificity phosphatase PhoE
MKHLRKVQLITTVAALLLGANGIAAQPSTIILVRHAEKASSGSADPALSAIGTQRAHDLEAALRDAHIKAIIVTQYQRTSATAADVMAAEELAPIVVRVSRDLSAHIKNVAATVRAQPAGSTVLVVGHSNTIPAIVAALGGPPGPEICESQYANMFIITEASSDSPRLVRARYGAPDPAPGDECASAMHQN